MGIAAWFASESLKHLVDEQGKRKRGDLRVAGLAKSLGQGVSGLPDRREQDCISLAGKF